MVDLKRLGENPSSEEIKDYFNEQFGNLRSLLGSKRFEYRSFFGIIESLFEIDEARANEKVKPYILQHLMNQRIKSGSNSARMSSVDLTYLLPLKKRFDVIEILKNVSIVFGVYDETVKEVLTGLDLSEISIELGGWNEANTDDFFEDFDISEFKDYKVNLNDQELSESLLASLKYATELSIVTENVNELFDMLNGLDFERLEILWIQDESPDIIVSDSDQKLDHAYHRLDFSRIFGFKADNLKEILIKGIAENNEGIELLNNYSSLTKANLQLFSNSPISLNLVELPNLKSLDLEGDIISFGSIVTQGSLESLTLTLKSSENGLFSDEDLYNEFGDVDLSSLRNLTIEPGYITDESLEYLITNASNLESLIIHDCEIELELFDPEIVNRSKLKVLNLPNNFISDDRISKFQSELDDRIELRALGQNE